ncbi:hypothetical protein JCM11491_000892 [Sporobolomyces phaffii]
MAPRTDRALTALRPLAISQSLLSRSDGSAQFSFGNVTVLTSVTGPVEVRLRDEVVDRATLEFNLVPLVHSATPGPAVKAMEETVRHLFTPVIVATAYPRSLIQITAQTVSKPLTDFAEPLSTRLEDSKGKGKATSSSLSGASERAARINAISVALIDAGVQLRGVLVAVAVAVLADADDSRELVLDPTEREELDAASTHVVTVSYGLGVGGDEGEIVGVESIGTFTDDELFAAHDLGLNATATILGFVRKSVEAKYGVTDPRPSPTTTATRTSGNEVKMCVAEEGRDMSDDDDDDEVMI